MRIAGAGRAWSIARFMDETMSSFLFKNANVVLDGQRKLQPGFNILVTGDRIEAVARDPIERPDAQSIDVAGRTVMPGLIDAHAHITGLSLSPKNLAYPAADLVGSSRGAAKGSNPDQGVRIRRCHIPGRRPPHAIRILRRRARCLSGREMRRAPLSWPVLSGCENPHPRRSGLNALPE